MGTGLDSAIRCFFFRRPRTYPRLHALVEAAFDFHVNLLRFAKAKGKRSTSPLGAQVRWAIWAGLLRLHSGMDLDLKHLLENVPDVRMRTNMRLNAHCGVLGQAPSLWIVHESSGELAASQEHKCIYRTRRCRGVRITSVNIRNIGYRQSRKD